VLPLLEPSVIINNFVEKPSGSAGVSRPGFLVWKVGQLYGVEVEALNDVQEGGCDMIALE
jgi:hypothetical protein